MEELNIADYNGVEVEENFLKSSMGATVYWAFYLMLLIFGVCGNSFVWISIARKKVKQTQVNLILANLAVADTIVCILSFLMGPIKEVTGHLFISKYTCHAVLFLATFTEYFATMAVVLPLIIYSFFQEISAYKCWAVISVHWIIAITHAIIPAINMDLFVTMHGISHCVESWSYSGLRNYFKVFNTFSKVFYPLAATIGCLVVHKITKNKFLKDNFFHRMLFLLVAISIVLWTPVTIVRLSDVLFNVFDWFIASTYLSLVFVVYKPILYVCLNKKFQKEFKAQFSCCLNRSEATVHYSIKPVENDAKYQ